MSLSEKYYIVKIRKKDKEIAKLLAERDRYANRVIELENRINEAVKALHR